MGRAGELLLRAATPRGGLGNLIQRPASGGSGAVVAGTQNISYVGDNQPLQINWSAEQMSRDAYLGNIYVMRCARLIAETIAGLPWVSGPDPTNPSDFNKTSTLANLLGPATPQAPGGPNPKTSSRAFWAWSIVQYLITGRFGWEAQLDGPAKNKEIVGLWPLVSACLSPIPTTHGEAEWFQGYEYFPPTGRIEMTSEQVVYCWRPRIDDWRQPESVLDSARFPVYIATSIQKYIANLLKNGMVASTLVVTPEFATIKARRAWQDQFLAEFTGVNKAGATIFGEMDFDAGDNPNAKPVQVEKLASTVVDSGLNTFGSNAQNDICLAFGVPRSLIGDASQRTYANAASEYKNFWVLTVLNLIAEIQDHVNMELAPRIGTDVGWFDLSRVAAVQPEAIFAPPDITAVIETGVADADQIANVLNIPPADATDDSDTDTVNLGQESSSPGPGGGRGNANVIEYLRSLPEGPMRDAIVDRTLYALRHPRDANVRYLNVDVLRTGYKEQPAPREVIRLPETAVRTRKALSVSGRGIDQASRMLEQVEGIRKLATADRLADEVHRKLAKTYPESTLGWVDDADWSGPSKVDLADIDMAGRPGGRDQSKVKGIAKGIVEGDAGATAPVVLVATPGSDKLAVADGYHRTLAHKRVGHDSVPAYVGEVDQAEGPWDEQMHANKLNRADELFLDLRLEDFADELADELEYLVRYDTSPLGTGKNWVTKVGGFDGFVRAIAHALQRNGRSEAEAIQLAIGAVKRWAAGGGHVTAQTREKAAASVAHWERMKASA